MSLSVINNNFCKLRKVRPIIMVNDKKLNNKYIKERFRNAQNKNIFSLKIPSSNYINIKTLMNPNMEKTKENANTIMSSLRNNTTDESNKSKSNNNKKILTENRNENFNTIKSEKNIKLPKLKRSILKNVKTPKLNLLNSQSNFRNKTLKINKSTNISREKNKSKNINNENNYNTINCPERKDKIFTRNINSNILLISKSSKIKNFLLERNNFPLKKLLLTNNKKGNFITNVKPADSGMKEYKVFDNLYNKTIINSKKKLKKDESMESLSDNSIWNDYTKMEKEKTNAIERDKNYMEEKMHIISKLFKNSYSYKKYNNKGIKNQKEKYLNYLDDYSLALRVNYIKNNLLSDRGGKQNLRIVYNPFNK